MRKAGLVTTAVISASASILVAVLAFILNQRGQIRQERRQARLARINSQLRELYGPLNALVEINERIWEELRRSTVPAKDDREPGQGTDEWRRWRDRALTPANHTMRDLIINHADLLLEVEVPPPLRDFCAHVAATEVAFIGTGEGMRERALIRHPGAAYVDHVRETFLRLKREQRRLLQELDHRKPDGA
jgi:hypothetical protein